MSKNLYIISTGIGDFDLISKKGEKVIMEMDILTGYPQLKKRDFGKPFYETKNIEELKEIISKFDGKKIGILVSGDAGFFSFAKKIYKELKDSIAGVIPSVSTFQYALAKIFETYEDVHFFSLHSNDNLEELKNMMTIHNKIFILLRNIEQARMILKLTNTANSEITFFADLNTENEIITHNIDDLNENCQKIAVYWRKNE